ncbi:MAG: hypothetical protein RLZZ470_714 [Pseudomonadota bacterium]
MGFAQVHSCAVLGLGAARVTVEVHLANGLPNFTLVGLADTEVRESRERVRSAIQNSGLEFPSNKRITVNLAPADLPKDSGRFDLPIALGILAAAGLLDAAHLAPYVFAGELSLSGELRAVRGALAMGLALCQSQTPTPGTPVCRWVLPPHSAEEAAWLPDAWVYRAAHLRDVVQAFAQPPGETSPGWQRLAAQTWPSTQAHHGLDLQDVRGQANAKRALEIAAAGGHSLLMQGPPGSGKSMLAQRLIGLLPRRSSAQALASAAMMSLAGQFEPSRWGQAVLRQPHHSVSRAAMLGGGVPPRPGEISLAHHGVLFLDELPEFSRHVLEALREPLETGCVHLARGRHQVAFAAQFQLIAAMNPCPCGLLGATPPACRCSPEQVQRYQARLSGPLLDRIDMQVSVPALPPEVLLNPVSGETTAQVQARCQQAHDRAMARRGVRNHALNPAQLMALPISASAQQHLQEVAARQAWSARLVHRCLRLAQTIADLAQADEIDQVHLAQAVHYRALGLGRPA